MNGVEGETLHHGAQGNNTGVPGNLVKIGLVLLAFLGLLVVLQWPVSGFQAKQVRPVSP